MDKINTPDGLFIDGTRRVPGTPVPAWWLNQLQNEFIACLIEAGILPDKDNHSQLLTAMKSILEKLSSATVASIADLRQKSGVSGQVVNVRGYYADTPGVGGGHFVGDTVSSSPDNGGTVIQGQGIVWQRVKTQPDLHDFGAKGDYGTDDTEAFAAAVKWADTTTKTLVLPSGVFRMSRSFDLPNGLSIKGVGSPKIATFPMVDSNKINLKPGQKHKITGSVLMFGGNNDTPVTINTGRNDRYAVLKPCLAYQHNAANQMRGFAIVQDMDVYTANGVYTTGDNDNRARGYTAGYLTSATLSQHEDLNVFGYFDAAGLVVYSKFTKPNTIDCEYPSFTNCAISGGTAIIGSDTPEKSNNISLTGLMASNCGFYGSDHHNRPHGDYTIPALLIDGALNTKGIRGQSFATCQFRTYANEAIKLNYCDDTSFVSCITEFAGLVGVNNAEGNGKIVGTANTGNVRMFGLAATADIGLLEFAATISGKFQMLGAGGFKDAYFGERGRGIVLKGERNTGDSTISLTNDMRLSNTGWDIRRDDDEADKLDFRYKNTSKIHFDLSKSAFAPGSGNSIDLGAPGFAWRNGYFGTTPIVTSDEQAKQDIEPIPQSVIEAWRDVDWQRYRFIDAVDKKGAGARYHVGLLAQTVKSVFDAHGLDAQHYGLLCLTQWPAVEAKDAVISDDGDLLEPAVEYCPAGERWGVRMEECLAMEAESQRRLVAALTERIKKLEAAIME